ncbi:MAG: aminotransferase class I/II-fold pyridoxal phosphate-dependent enzyme, partial [Acidobacteria bacterium]|nr:aminotransferase class I/II-fold pyridoxal phosphate-dependent enzyme [Acidobacteriota bacterium]
GLATSKEAADLLLHKYGVVCTDGGAFGAEGYLRLSYANSMEALREAVERIKQLVADRAQ